MTDRHAKAVDAEESLKATIREGHEMIQDLKALMKEATTVAERLEVAVHQQVDDTIKAELEAGLVAWNQGVDEAMTYGTERVLTEFARLQTLLIDRTREGFSIAEFIENLPESPVRNRKINL